MLVGAAGMVGAACRSPRDGAGCVGKSEVLWSSVDAAFESQLGT